MPNTAPSVSFIQAFNWGIGSVYSTLPSVMGGGIVVGGSPMSIKTDEKQYNGIGAQGAIAAGLSKADDLKVSLVCTSDTKLLLQTAFPASITAPFTDVAFGVSDGMQGWNINDGFIKSLSLDMAVEEALKAEVGFGGRSRPLETVPIAQTALASEKLFTWEKGSITVASGAYLMQGLKLDITQKYRMGTDLDAGKATNSKRWATFCKRTGQSIKGSFDSLKYFDSDVAEDVNTAPVIVATLSDGTATITITCTFTTGITTEFMWDYVTDDGVAVYKYAFACPDNKALVVIT